MIEIRKPKTKKWIRVLGLLGLMMVCYQVLNISLALAKNFNPAFVLYTLEVVAMVLLVQISVYLWRKGVTSDER